MTGVQGEASVSEAEVEGEAPEVGIPKEEAREREAPEKEANIERRARREDDTRTISARSQWEKGTPRRA